jgi:hypothetical protein
LSNWPSYLFKIPTKVTMPLMIDEGVTPCMKSIFALAPLPTSHQGHDVTNESIVYALCS